MTLNKIAKRMFLTEDKIWLSSPHMSGREMKYIDEAFSQNYVFPLGPNVEGLEQDLEKFTGAKYAACLSSGTAGLHLALIVLGISAGDEVIVSTFTFAASVNPVVYQKATPVFVDSEPDTWNMDSELLEEAILDRLKRGKKPKAIIVVHLYGMPANMDKIMRISMEYDIPVIEDAAEALGASFNGKMCGTFGEIGILSFNGNKIITTSGGGALLSEKKEYCERATFLATQARDKAPFYQHSNIGYNYRMSNICAGIGRGQMEVLPEFIRKRRENFTFYREMLKDTEGLIFPDEQDKRFYTNRWLTTLLIDPEKTNGISCSNLLSSLEKENIESRRLWKPMHLQPVFKNEPAYINGTSEKLFDSGLCLPSGSNITEEQRFRVVKTIIKKIKDPRK